VRDSQHLHVNNRISPDGWQPFVCLDLTFSLFVSLLPAPGTARGAIVLHGVMLQAVGLSDGLSVSRKRYSLHCRLAVWLSGNALASINVVALPQTRLVPGWVTVCGWVITISVCNQPTRSTQPSTLRRTVKRVSSFGLSNNNKWRWWV